MGFHTEGSVTIGSGCNCQGVSPDRCPRRITTRKIVTKLPVTVTAPDGTETDELWTREEYDSFARPGWAVVVRRIYDRR